METPRSVPAEIPVHDGRILMGDLIGWDRVAELAAERKANRASAARLRFAGEHGGRPSVLKAIEPLIQPDIDEA